ncbi:MAG: FAD-dependent oxidoreductase [Bacteroidales bacterium]|nr:FAD-dependent oxidoreductase [Bacteroidales bacterium]
MAPIKLGYASGDGKVNERHVAFYEARSPFLGAITIEPLYLDAGLREIPTQLGIDSDDKVAGLTMLVNTIHKHNTKVIAHLSHPGRMANPNIPGNYFISATDKACENGGAIPVKMNNEMMDRVIQQFVDAAKRAEKCGFDMLEVQFGHGYLLAQYLSPAVNTLIGSYNGNLTDRSRYPLKVLQEIKKSISIPVIARISADEMEPRGFHLDEMITFSKLLEQNGIDAIHVSAGSTCSTPPWFFQHMFVPKGKTWEMASAIKHEAKVPVIFVGQVNTVEDINTLKNKYRADYIAIGRAMVADPEFIGKYLGRVKGNIRPCLACSDGCLGNVRKGNGLKCVVNPWVNNKLPELTRAANRERIGVIGGGLAGMQAAIILKERGYEVTLYEKDKLGGQFNLAFLPPGKESLSKIVNYYKDELSLLEIPVVFEEATKDTVLNGHYNRIVMATGATPAIPPVKGLKKYYWTEFLHNDQLPDNETILIIGGGLIGLEVASKLVEGHNRVIIVEMLEETGRGMEPLEKSYTLKKLQANQTQVYTQYKVTEINDHNVTIESNQGTKTTITGIHKIIIAAGMRSYVPFNLDNQLPVYYIGDAKTVGKAENAIYEACSIALSL